MNPTVLVPTSFTITDNFQITEDTFALAFFFNSLLGFEIKDGLEIDVDRQYLSHPNPDLNMPDGFESYLGQAQARAKILLFMTAIGRSGEQLITTWKWCKCSVGFQNWAAPVDRIFQDNVSYYHLMADLAPYCEILADSDIVADEEKQKHMLELFEWCKTHFAKVEVISSVSCGELN